MRALKAYGRSPAALIGTAILLAVVVMGVGASWFYPNDPLGLAGRPLQWPGANPRFPLGTDPSGRDIAAQLFHDIRMRRHEANPPGQRGRCGIEARTEEQDAVVVNFLRRKGCAASRRNVIASRQQLVKYVVLGVTILRLACSRLDVRRDQGVDSSQVLQLGGAAGVR